MCQSAISSLYRFIAVAPPRSSTQGVRETGKNSTGKVNDRQIEEVDLSDPTRQIDFFDLSESPRNLQPERRLHPGPVIGGHRRPKPLVPHPCERPLRLRLPSGHA